MNNKKRITALIIGIMLASLTTATVPTATAMTYIEIYGFVYVDGDITDPTDVSLIFQNHSPIPYDELLGGGAYKIAFDADVEGVKGMTGTFNVVVSGQTWTAAETVTIPFTNYIFYINLTVNTSGPPMFSNPSPTGTGVSIGTSSLSIYIEDPDGDSFDWSITTSPNIGSNSGSGDTNGTKTCGISGLAYSTTYAWTVSATDGTGWRNTSYSFTTKSKPSGNGGNGGNGGETNKDPVADASAGEPYSGFIDEEITFDGSGSSDSDGTITNYTWDFGDGNTGYGETTTHAYSNTGTHTVILKVTDNDGATDTDVTTAEISQPNIPPTDPIVNGPENGTQNTEYNFTAQSTDPDINDTIQYIFEWGDGETTTTEFLPSGTATTQTHSWTDSGEYTINVTAYDNATASSETTEFVISIEEEKEPIEPEEEYDYTWLILLLILIIILIIIGYLLSKGKKKPEGKKQPPKKSSGKSGKKKK